MIALLALTALGQDALTDLRREALLYPGDYATHVALARAAEAVGDDETAWASWSRAVALSEANLESSLGRIPVAVRLGHTDTAREDARHALDLAPGLPEALLLHAWAWRSDPVLPGLGGWIAEQSYLRYAALRPADGAPWCGVGWVRALRGDRLGARNAFDAAMARGDACADDGLTATRPAVEAWGTALGTAIVYQDHPDRGAGGAGLLTAGARLGDVAHLEASGRALGIGTTGAALTQGEVWGRLGLTHAGHGLEALAGGTWTGGPVTTSSLTVGGGAWLTVWATLRGDLSWTRFGDGDLVQGDVRLTLPLTPAVTATTGVHLGRFQPFDGVDTDEDDTLRASAHLDLTASMGRLTLSAGGRVGPEVRPLRPLTATLFNLDDRLTASGRVGATVTATPFLDVHLGYEVLRLQSPSTGDLRHEHLASLGLTLHTRTPLARTTP